MSDAEVLDRGDVIEVEDKLPPSTIDDTKEVEEKLEELTGEKAEAAEEADEQPRAKDGKFQKKEREVPDHVPKARFDDAVGKERAAREAAERRAAQLEERVMQESKSVDVAKMEEAIEALEAKHSKLLLDGEHEAAAKVMKEIRHGERQIANLENNEKMSRATSQAVEQVRMEASIARLEADYPALAQGSEEYDQDLVDLVLAEQSRLIQVDRMSPSAALVSAGNKIMKKFGSVTAKAAEPAGLGAAKGSDRKAEQVAKNLDTAKRQPSSTSEAGEDSNKRGVKDALPDVSKMTQEEINALPESTRKKLRGDSY